ncbi:MAG TPA: hypothetical protein VMU62_02620 [Acidobacteriaceae bacterium]|nr:hypothetical protein [Acidobacteriaceae bacterium]
MLAPTPIFAQNQGGQAPNQRPQDDQRPQQTNHPAQRPQQQNRPQQNHNARPTPQHNRPSHARPAARPQTRPARTRQARPNYQFRSQDTSRLRQHYQGGFGRIDRQHRPRFARGGYIPGTYRGYFQPVPYNMIGYLPPVPPGYAMGYYDGYVVVYNPGTYLILSVLNLLQ